MQQQSRKKLMFIRIICIFAICVFLMLTNVFVSVINPESPENQESSLTTSLEDYIGYPVEEVDSERLMIGIVLLLCCIASAIALIWQIRPYSIKKNQ